MGRTANENPGNSLTPDFFSKGEPLVGIRPKLNLLVQQARAERTGVNPPRQRDETGLKIPPVVQRFYIVEVGGDYLICNPATGNPETDATLVFVAKSPLLRTSVVSRGDFEYSYTDNQTRVSTNGDAEEENQVVVPSYEVDDEIFAINQISGGTNVASGSQDQTEVTVEWQDVNADARAWAKASS